MVLSSESAISKINKGAITYKLIAKEARTATKIKVTGRITTKTSALGIAEVLVRASEPEIDQNIKHLE